MTTRTTTTSGSNGEGLRARRLALGITRAQLAHRARCSLAFLASVEQGYTPKTSAALDRAFAALDAADELEPRRHDDED
jgi:transcriptional regulator with XRE-family HTH domain